MSLHFDITGDNSNLLRKLEEARNGVRSTSKQIEESGVSIEQMFGRMAKGAAKIGAGITAKEIVSNIVRIRGEFQQLEVAFKTMLGSEERANSLMQQLVRTAATTPFDLQSVAKGAKQLLAYGTNAENVNDELITLGNVAAGISVPLGDLVYLYGTLRSQGRAYSVDIKQFAGRGVPIYAELAKVMGVNVEKVNALIEAGKVGFPQVEQAFKNMTSTGGMFNNLMQEQSKTITGQISNIGDSISMMYNNIGKSSEGFINEALSGVSYLVENYEQVGKTILELAAAYGSYKAVLMSVAAYQSFAVGITYSTEIAELSKLIPLKRQSANEDVITAVASGKLTQSKAEQVIALRAEIAAKIQSLQATKAQAQAEFSSALATYKASRLRYTVAQEQVALAQSQMSIAIKSGTVEEIAAAKKNAQTASLELNNAAVAKNTAHKGVNIAATNSKSASEALNTVQTGLNTVSQNTNTISTNILTAAKTRLAAASKALGLSMLANPYVLVTAAIVGLGYAVYKASTAENELDKAHKRLTDATNDVEKSLISEVSKLTTLERKLSETKKGTEEYNAIKKTIVDNYGQYYKGLDGEIERVGNLSTVYGQLVEAMRQSIGQRKFESFFKAEQDNLDKAIGEKLNTAYETLIDKYGKTKGANLYNQFFDSSMHGESLSPSAIKDLQNATFIDVKWGSNAKDGILDFRNSVFDLRSEISKETKATEEALDKYKSKFQITEEEIAKITSGSTLREEQPVENKTLKQLLIDIDKANTELKSLQKQANKGLISSDKVKEQSDALSKLTADYKLRTGKEFGSTKQDKSAEELREQQEKLKELSLKQAVEQKRSAEDLQNQIAQSTINAMDNGFEKVQAQREFDNKKEIQAIERQKEDYIRAYVQAQKELFDAEEDLSAKKKKGYVKQIFDISTVNVQGIIDAWDKIIDKSKTQQVVDEWQKREESMNAYLLEYGTFSQKKAAIDKKFQDAINGETDLGAISTLKKQWDEAISSLNLNKLKKEINWEVVFGDLKKVTKKQLQEVKKQLTEFKKSDEFKNAAPDQVKVIEEAIDNINNALVDKGGFFGGLSDSLKDYKEKLEEAKKAQEEYDQALKTGNEALIEKATENRNTANTNVINSGIGVEKSGDKAVNNINAVSSAIIQLGKKDISLTDIGNTVGALVDTLGKSGSMIGGIISAILSIIDAAGDIGTFQYGMNLVGNVSSKVTDAFARDTEAITGIDMSFMKSADYDDYNELKEQYETINSIWGELIDKKIEYLEIGTTEERKRTEGEILDLIGKQEQAYRNLGLERLNAGSSAGSHSIGVRIKKGMSDEGWQQVKNALGEELYSQINDGRMEKLFSLSSEQLEKLKGNSPDFWAKLDDDVKKYLEDIIKCGEQTEETTKKAEELWAGMSFDSMIDQFKSALSDMDSSTEDFADDFQQYMINAMIDSFVNGEVFQKKLKDWHKKLAEYSESDKEITKDEKNDLQEEWNSIVKEGIDYRNNLFESMGFKNSSSASSESLDSFVSQIEGAFTSLNATAKDVSNNIYDYFRQAMIKALYDKEYKSKMENLFNAFEGLSADGGLSESDMAQLNSQIDIYVNQMMKGVEGVNGLFADKLKAAEDIQSFVDNVKSAMSSIESTAEDVTDNIFEYIRKQMVDKMFADTFQPQIEEFYKKVQAAMSDGSITDSERDALRKEADTIAKDIVAAKDILSNTLGVEGQNIRKEAEQEFKSFSDGLLGSLYNAEVAAESVAKNISETMRNELIKAMYMEQYEPRIKAIWDKWKEYSSDGLVTDEERASIKGDIADLSTEVTDAAKEISDAWKDTGEEVKKAFESFSDSINNTLYNAETTAEDVSKNIYQFMRNALVDSMFSAQLQPQIKAWHDKYTEFMKDGAIDSVERTTLDEMIAEIQKAGMEIVNAANGAFPSLDTGAQKRADEAENARNEAEQEWESFSDDMLNSLYDLEASADDISDNMGEYMRKALIKAMYVNNYKPQMQKWYNEWQRAMGDDNLTSEEKQTLDSMKQEMIDGMKKEADAINQMFDSMYSQEASSKGFEGMSQDTGEELNGRFTAANVALEGIRSSNEDIKNSMLTMLSSMGLISTSDNSTLLVEIKNIMISSNSYLEDIAGFQKRIVNEFGSKLDSINKNIEKAL